MKEIIRKLARVPAVSLSVVLVVLMLGVGAPLHANAAEAEARALVEAMSGYMAAQQSLSFAYDADLEVVTTGGERLTLASSGAVTLNRPDKIRASRTGGFARIESVFDGKTLSLLGKNANVYVQVEIPGTIGHLIDELKDKYNRPLPAADLLLMNAHEHLMRGVVEIKDLGSGVIGGTECDHLAFRTEEVDWQIWIAQGDRPYPCRYVITSKLIAGSPQYSVQIRDWKAGDAVASDAFRFVAPTGAMKVDVKDLRASRHMDELPSHFSLGDPQ
jgi:hypothetical protein